MSGVQVTTSGTGFKKTEAWLQKMRTAKIFSSMDRFGREGVAALSAATPKDSGETAFSWTYEIKISGGTYEIVWKNTHMTDDGRSPVAILLQYGHGTGTGGYVSGRDYINPAMRPIFERIKSELRKVVSAA